MRPKKEAGVSGSRVLGLAFLAAAACVSSQARAQSCEPQNAAQKFPSYAGKTVKIGVNPTYPPFSYDDPKDMTKLTGLDVEIIERAMACAGLKVEYVRGQTSGLYPALFAGTLDVMLGNIFIRPDRTDKAGFVLYMVNGQSLVVKKGNSKRITSVEAMCGHTATGLYVGSSAIVIKETSGKCVERGAPAIDYTAAADQEQAYRSLANDRTDMVMDGAGSAALRVNAAEGDGLEIAFTLQTGMKSGVIVPKGNREMLDAVGAGLKQLEADGELVALMKKYGLQADWLIPVEVVP